MIPRRRSKQLPLRHWAGKQAEQTRRFGRREGWARIDASLCPTANPNSDYHTYTVLGQQQQQCPGCIAKFAIAGQRTDVAGHNDHRSACLLLLLLPLGLASRVNVVLILNSVASANRKALRRRLGRSSSWQSGQLTRDFLTSQPCCAQIELLFAFHLVP